MKKKVFICLVVLLFLFPSAVALADNLTKLDEGGMRILTIVRRIGFWIILVKGLSDVIKAGVAGDYKAVNKIIIGNIMLYGALYLLPWGLRLVEGIF